MIYDAVLLQAMKEDPPPDARCRDKFLVQSVAITAEREMPNVTAIWQNVEKTSKWAIQERKIRVLFLPADGSMATPTHNNVDGTVRFARMTASSDNFDRLLAHTRRSAASLWLAILIIRIPCT